jgi:Rrf2 family protein
MQVNRSTDYALRAMTYLATQPLDEVSMVNEIALNQSVPPKFLARLLQQLHKAGLVASQRGIKGGFRLARPSASITVLHVLEAVEGPIVISLCLTTPKACDQSERCPSMSVWERAQAAFLKVLGNTTIADLAQEQQRRDSLRQSLLLTAAPL